MGPTWVKPQQGWSRFSFCEGETSGDKKRECRVSSSPCGFTEGFHALKTLEREIRKRQVSEQRQVSEFWCRNGGSKTSFPMPSLRRPSFQGNGWYLSLYSPSPPFQFLISPTDFCLTVLHYPFRLSQLRFLSVLVTDCRKRAAGL